MIEGEPRVRPSRRARWHHGAMGAATALLVMDVQNAIVARLEDDGEPLLAAIATATAAARGAGVPVIYVRIAFRAGGPEISSRNRMLATAMGRGGSMALDDDATEIHDAVAPRDGDVTVIK